MLLVLGTALACTAGFLAWTVDEAAQLRRRVRSVLELAASWEQVREFPMAADKLLRAAGRELRRAVEEDR